MISHTKTKTRFHMKWEERVIIFADTLSQRYKKRGPVAGCGGWKYQRYLEVEQLLSCLIEQNTEIELLF